MPTRILLLGLGSIGTRQARLLREHFPDVEVTALRRTESSGNALGLPELRSWDEVVPGAFDAAIVANPTSLHIDTAIECARRGMHLFLEKPIDCRLEGLDELVEMTRGLTTYVAYPLRHHRVVQELRDRLAGREVRQVAMVSASFLPDWRPGRDHLHVHSARADMGGGVLLEMSHELDLAQHLFGPVLSMQGVLRRVADVTVDADDCADLLLSFAWGTANIQLNMISRFPRRTIVVETADGYLAADIRSQTLTDLRGDRLEELDLPSAPDDMYVAQLHYFLDNLGRTDLGNNLLQASDLYRQMIALREDAGYGTTDHHLRTGRFAGGQG